ncbi:MAG: rRNA maturation RNase YbeY [Actinomycetota bacterium]
MNIAVSGSDRRDVQSGALAEFVESILIAEGVPPDASLAVTFVSVEDISDLNERFMGKEGPTDVLSFPIEDASPGQPPRAVEGGPPLALGDIFICTDVVETHATEYGVSFDEELYLMVVHGVLHILGWDHIGAHEARAMESREATHLAAVGRNRR